MPNAYRKSHRWAVLIVPLYPRTTIITQMLSIGGEREESKAVFTADPLLRWRRAMPCRTLGGFTRANIKPCSHHNATQDCAPRGTATDVNAPWRSLVGKDSVGAGSGDPSDVSDITTWHELRHDQTPWRQFLRHAVSQITIRLTTTRDRPGPKSPWPTVRQSHSITAVRRRRGGDSSAVGNRIPFRAPIIFADVSRNSTRGEGRIGEGRQEYVGLW